MLVHCVVHHCYPQAVQSSMIEHMLRTYSAPDGHHVRQKFSAVRKICCNQHFSRTAISCWPKNCVRGTFLGQKIVDCSNFLTQQSAIAATSWASGDERSHGRRLSLLFSCVRQVDRASAVASKCSAECE